MFTHEKMNIVSHSKIKVGNIINWCNGKAFEVSICISFQKILVMVRTVL